MQVTIKNIYISPGHNYFGRYGKSSLNHAIVERDQIELVAGKGIVDDRFFDYMPNYKGQITFFDWQVYELVMSEMIGGYTEPSKFRRNVMLDGVDLNDLIGKRFLFNGIEFTGSCECSPCFWMDEAFTEGTEDFLKGRGGLRARIVSNGVLKTGEGKLEILGEDHTIYEEDEKPKSK